jgi:predicted ArsR family transcriptional regulator
MGMDLPEASATAMMLAQPTRAHIFRLLVERRGGVRIEELAEVLGVHTSAVRQHLDRLLAAGLVERTPVTAGRGRPHFEWSVAPDAAPGDEPPTAYSDLSTWLTELTGSGAAAVRRAERAGRRIGRDIAPRRADTTPQETFQAALAALGFGPQAKRRRGRSITYRLRNCPYRRAVEQNPEVICALHRGVTEGLLHVIAPQAELADFRPKDPCSAGCLVEVAYLERGSTT